MITESGEPVCLTHRFYIYLNALSHLQEDLLTIEYVEENPADSNIGGCGHQGLCRSREEMHDTGKEPVGRILEVDETLCQVDGNGVHTDHTEEERPLPIVQHIHYVVEECKHDHGIGSD